MAGEADAVGYRGGASVFDGGGGSPAAGTGDGESPSRRTRKGMVLVEASGRPNTSYEFEAEVMVLHHPGVIRENYQPVVHAHNICQSARITSMVATVPDPKAAPESAAVGTAAPAGTTGRAPAVAAGGRGGGGGGTKEPMETAQPRGTSTAGLKSGERAVCRFRFLYRPEYLSVGTTIVLREGRTRGFGKVISVH
ncbi:unnamed protein product [Scytosiphon promiscuus]